MLCLWPQLKSMPCSFAPIAHGSSPNSNVVSAPSSTPDGGPLATFEEYLGPPQDGHSALFLESDISQEPADKACKAHFHMWQGSSIGKPDRPSTLLRVWTHLTSESSTNVTNWEIIHNCCRSGCWHITEPLPNITRHQFTIVTGDRYLCTQCPYIPVGTVTF